MTSSAKVSSSSTESKVWLPPRGLVCPLVTPLTGSGRVDHRSLRRLLAHVGRFADALLFVDLRWGEAGQLDTERRLELVSAALKLVDGRLPAMVCVTGKSLEQTRMLTDELHRERDRTGYAGQLYAVDYPLMYHGNRDLPKVLAEALRGNRIPLILGNDPHQAGLVKGTGRHRNIRTAVLKKIVRTPQVCAMIFRGSLRRSLGYQAALRDRGDFLFYDGEESVFLDSPGMGGVVSGGSNLLPALWKDVLRSSLNRYDTERQFLSHQQEIWKAGELLRALYRFCRPDPAARMKQLLARTGVIESRATASGTADAAESRDAELDRFLRRWDLK